MAEESRSSWTRRQVLAGGAAVPVVVAISGESLAQEVVAVRPSNEVLGAGLPTFGFNFAHYLAGGNTSSWVRYARMNSARNFTNPANWIRDEDLDDGAGVTDLASFEAAKADLRSNPDGTTYINWPAVLDAYENVVHSPTNFYTVNYLFSEANKNNLDLLVEMDVKSKWTLGWSGRWQNWQLCYAHAYYLAKNFGVRRFSFLNEPDVPGHAGEIPSIETYIWALRFATDAIRCAVEDAGRAAGVEASATVHAPVITRSTMSASHSGHPEGGPYAGEQNIELNQATTGYYADDARDDEVGWGRAALENLRIDYRGETVDYDIFDVWDTHSYMRRPDYYPGELDLIRSKLDEYTPADTNLPIMYTEINRFNNWGYGQTARTVDTPEIARDVCAIGANSITSDVDGMFFFKFAGARDAEGDIQGVGFYYVDDEAPYDIRGASRTAESLRLLAKSLTGDVRRLAVGVENTPDDFSAWSSYDPATHCYHVLSIKHFSGSTEFQLDLSELMPAVTPGTSITIEEISATYSGGISREVEVPDSKVLTLRQPGWNLWLATVPDGGVREAPSAVASRNALVRSDADADVNFGAREGLAVQRRAGGHEVTYLWFTPPAVSGDLARAVLEIYAHVPTGADSCTFGVFAVPDWQWSEPRLTWNSARFLSASDSLIVGAGDAVMPAGQLTVTESFTYARLDVTDIVAALPRQPITFCLIKQPRFDGDDEQDGRRVTFVDREATTEWARPRLRRWVTR